jgi:transposase
MKRFIEGEERLEATLLPDCLVSDENPVRVIDAFIDELDLKALGSEGAEPEATGRSGYHPATLLKIYLYGYLNRILSSRRLERETGRNLELMCRLMPDFKTIAEFRRENGLHAVCYPVPPVEPVH